MTENNMSSWSLIRGRAPSKHETLTMCWFNVGPSSAIGNVWCLLGDAPGANHSCTARCGGVTDLIVCKHLHLTLPLPQQRAIVVICSAKAVSAH